MSPKSPPLALWLLLALASGAMADGVVRDGIGAISSGRGGTNIGFADNGEVLLDNPAGIVNAPGRGLSELSFDILQTDLYYSDPDNGAHASYNPFPLGQLSVIKKSPDGLWAAGIGFYAPAGFGATFDLNGPAPIGGRHRYKSLGALARIIPGAAVRVTDRLTVGGTLGVAVSHVELEGPWFLQNGTPTVFDLQGTGATITWSAGLQYELTPATTLGVAYQSQTSFNLDGSAQVNVPGFGEGRFDAATDIKWPRSLGIGVKHDLCKHRTVALDVIWFDWSDAFDTVDVELTNPTNPAFNALGSPIRESLALRWKDSISVRLGMEQALSPCSVARCGYAYHPNQVPEGTLTPFIPAILEHAFSVGYGHKVGGGEVDLAYQFSFGRDRTVGASDLPGGDFSNSRVEAQAHWIFLSYLNRF